MSGWEAKTACLLFLSKHCDSSNKYRVVSPHASCVAEMSTSLGAVGSSGLHEPGVTSEATGLLIILSLCCLFVLVLLVSPRRGSWFSSF
jgi:hypothetical protein